MATDPPVPESFSYWLHRFADLKAKQERLEAEARATKQERLSLVAYFEEKEREAFIARGSNRQPSWAESRGQPGMSSTPAR